jgi:hypothetical protein
MRAAAGLATLLLVAAPAQAVEEDAQAWTNFLSYGRVHGDLAFWFDMSIRWTNDYSRLGQVLFRPAIGWKPSDRFMAYAGYTFTEINQPGIPAVKEHRAFQQADIGLYRWNTGRIATRTRLEQRFFEGASGMAFRYRQKFFIRQDIPGTRLEALGTYEIFLTLKETDIGSRRGFEQGRVYAGVAIPINSRTKLETGYQNQWIPRAREDFMSHGWWITWAVRY